MNQEFIENVITLEIGLTRIRNVEKGSELEMKYLK